MNIENTILMILLILALAMLCLVSIENHLIPELIALWEITGAMAGMMLGVSEARR